MRQEADAPHPTDRSPPSSPPTSSPPSSVPVSPAPPPAPEPPAAGGDPSTGVRKGLRALGSIVAPTTLIAALLYWFGEVRVRTQSSELGVDHSVFGFSNQDYVTRSVTSMFLPIGVTVIAALVWLSAHWALTSWAASAGTGEQRSRRLRRMRWVLVALAAVGLGLFLAGMSRAFRTEAREEWWHPVYIGLGVALMAYAAYLWSRLLSRPRDARPGWASAEWMAPLFGAMVALLVVVCMFWAVTVYAEGVGRGLTDELVAGQLARRPSVVVYSERQLHIDAEGVTETPLEEAEGEAGYRFSYDGLKLLLFNDGKYFLLPAGWVPGDEPLIVLRDDDSVRLEFFR